MNNKKISIITVTYNSSKTIENLLNSLLLNKDQISDVVIIENNSKDKKQTKFICSKYIDKLKLKFIISENVGFGKSCNQGAMIANSNNILFLNPDTELQENSLKILLLHKIKSHAGIIGGKAINYEKHAHGSVVRLPNLFIGLFEFSNLGKIFNISSAHKLFYYQDINVLGSKVDKKVDAVSGAYMLTTKDIFKKLGEFDENIFMYLEDVDLGNRARKFNIKVVFCPHSLIWHIGGASSQNKYKIRHQAWFDSRKYYFKKHFGFMTNLIIQPLYTFEEFVLKKLKGL